MPVARPELIPMPWIKSSYSNPSGGDCVEVAVTVPGFVPVRDSKRPSGAVVPFPTATWTAFLDQVKQRGFTVR